MIQKDDSYQNQSVFKKRKIHHMNLRRLFENVAYFLTLNVVDIQNEAKNK